MQTLDFDHRVERILELIEMADVIHDRSSEIGCL